MQVPYVQGSAALPSLAHSPGRAVNLQGRLVVDVLRHCITAQSLETFSLVDCVHKLLGQTLEARTPAPPAPPPPPPFQQRLLFFFPLFSSFCAFALAATCRLPPGCLPCGWYPHAPESAGG